MKKFLKFLGAAVMVFLYAGGIFYVLKIKKQEDERIIWSKLEKHIRN